MLLASQVGLKVANSGGFLVLLGALSPLDRPPPQYIICNVSQPCHLLLKSHSRNPGGGRLVPKGRRLARPNEGIRLSNSTFAVCGLEHVAADQWAALLARSAGLARRMVQMIADALPR